MLIVKIRYFAGLIFIIIQLVSAILFSETTDNIAFSGICYKLIRIVNWKLRGVLFPIILQQIPVLPNILIKRMTTTYLFLHMITRHNLRQFIS